MLKANLQNPQVPPPIETGFLALILQGIEVELIGETVFGGDT
jgi:hypothetical protein